MARRHTSLIVVAAVLVIAVLAPLAAGKAKPRPMVKLVGNYALGGEVFNSTCATCHNVGLGPPLSHLNLTEAQIVTQIDNGGSAAAAANYGAQMPGYKGVVSPADVNNVAALVWLKVHDCPAYVPVTTRDGYTFTRC